MSKLGRRIIEDLMVERIEKNRLMAVSGMSIEELTDAFTKGYSLRNPEEQTDWIPVSERLPEDGQSVLFCDIDDDIMIGYHVKGRPRTHFSQDGTFEDMKNVRAWMPLPVPYNPQERSDKE